MPITYAIRVQSLTGTGNNAHSHWEVDILPKYFTKNTRYYSSVFVP